MQTVSETNFHILVILLNLLYLLYPLTNQDDTILTSLEIHIPSNLHYLILELLLWICLGYTHHIHLELLAKFKNYLSH